MIDPNNLFSIFFDMICIHGKEIRDDFDLHGKFLYQYLKSVYKNHNEKNCVTCKGIRLNVASVNYFAGRIFSEEENGEGKK